MSTSTSISRCTISTGFFLLVLLWPLALFANPTEETDDGDEPAEVALTDTQNDLYIQALDRLNHPEEHDPTEAIQLLETALFVGAPSSLLTLTLAHAHLLNDDCSAAEELLQSAQTLPPTSGVDPTVTEELHASVDDGLQNSCRTTLAVTCDHDDVHLFVEDLDDADADAPDLDCGDTRPFSPGPLSIIAQVDDVQFAYRLDLEPGGQTDLHVGLRPRSDDDAALFFDGDVVELTPDQLDHHERARDALDATPPQTIRALNHLRAALDDLQPSLSLYLLATEAHLDNDDCPAALDTLDQAHRAPATGDFDLNAQLRDLDDLDRHLHQHCISTLTLECTDQALDLQSDLIDTPRCGETYELAPQSLFVTVSKRGESHRQRVQLNPGQSKNLTLEPPPSSAPSSSVTTFAPTSQTSDSSPTYAIIPSFGHRTVTVDNPPDPDSPFTSTTDLDFINGSLAFWTMPRSRFALEVLYGINSSRDRASAGGQRHHQLQLHALVNLVGWSAMDAWVGAGLSLQSRPHISVTDGFSSLGFTAMKLHNSFFAHRSVSPFWSFQVDLFTANNDRSTVTGLFQTGLMFNFGH